MAIEESLLQAIKKDDYKAFNALMEKAQCGAYRLGRFPVLSLLYLYKSRRIISAYEEKFLKITAYEPLREPAEVSKKFSLKAGKCLRLYFSEVVTPLEMLLILDKTRRLKRVYPLTKPSAAVKGRLKSIYSIKYALNVEFEGDGIIIDRRPLSYREKKNIATACLCTVLAITVAVGVPVTTVALIPKPVPGEVTKLSQIDFNSKEEYTLKKDVVIPDNYSVGEVNCKITGEGKKLILGKGATLGELNGELSDLIIESSGDAIFNTVSETAVIGNVTVNVGAAVTVTESTALIALTNYGTIESLTVNVSGSINAVGTDTQTNTELNFGAIVLSNDYKYDAAAKKVYRGMVKNCTVNYSQFTLSGEASANAAFGGVAGINSGYLQDCTVSGEIIADTFDIAGVCLVNYGMLTGNVNEADISQTSAETGWNPITCGIVLNNAYAVENCENKGKISAVSTCGRIETTEEYEHTVSAVGIAYINRSSTANPYIRNCSNLGNVESKAQFRDAYAAGVCLSSSGTIEGCINGGSVTVTSDNGCGTYAGGITTLSYGNLTKSVNEGAVTVTGNGTAYVGGISAHSCAQISNCLSSGDVTVKANDVSAGGILGYSEVTRYGFYVYCGNVDNCISESKLSVAVTGDTTARVGGIVGLINEAGYTSGGSVVYFGGSVTDCYFTGECKSEINYFGNIVGVVGANIYESNSYFSGITEYHNFEDNYYLDNSLTAFGAALTEESEFISVEDKGATSANIEDIQNSETYKAIKAILNAIEN